MEKLYCWRCKTVVPMLDAEEWKQISPLIGDDIRQVKDYRARTGASVAEGVLHRGTAALDKYFELTGCRLAEFDELPHHRLSQIGPECPSCGKPLRTPQARICAECGATRQT